MALNSNIDEIASILAAGFVRGKQAENSEICLDKAGFPSIAGGVDNDIEDDEE
jgi:hypothetical protein